ncbi:unnamed protein product [Amoebophrya sp. A120]|nr:unnamed protein product [Amoebophrya sp. A120]|eukprot:GSA120T00019050001.1
MEEMQQFFQTMPWVTVPYRNVECSGRLKLLFRVTEVPKLVCVNCQTLEMITVAGSRGASCGGGPRQFLHPGGQHASYPEAVPSTSRAAGPNRIAECTDRLQCMDLRKRFGPGADALEAYDDLDYTDASHAQSATES